MNTTDSTLIIPAVDPLDQYENALIQYLKTSVGHNKVRLVDLLSIYCWRCYVEEKYVRMADVAEFMLDPVERFGLIGYAGVFGLYTDASPERTWYFGLDTSGYSIPDFRNEEGEHHWIRLIGVLASRLTLSEVCKLPGYNHDATEGPFGGKTV